VVMQGVDAQRLSSRVRTEVASSPVTGVTDATTALMAATSLTAVKPPILHSLRFVLSV